MSDEFLYRLREPPRPEFAEALRERILREPPRSPTGRRIRAGLVVLLAALIIAACAAPQTRTPILRATETVIAQRREVVARVTFVGERALPHLVMTFPCVEGSDFKVETLSVQEAQRQVPFQIRVPTWVPEGLEMNPVTLVHPEGFGDWVVYIEWRGASSSGVLFPEFGGAPLSLTIEGPGVKEFQAWCAVQLRNESVRVRVRHLEATLLPAEVRTAEVNGKPTQLAVREEGPHPSAVLQWVREEDNVSYTLTANLDMVSLEDLIRVAETIR